MFLTGAAGSSVGTTGAQYGFLLAPVVPGSGGGTSGVAGGAGGGAIALFATTLVVKGSIQMNGANGLTTAASCCR